jgi:hypothetical protein
MERRLLNVALASKGYTYRAFDLSPIVMLRIFNFTFSGDFGIRLVLGYWSS